MDLKNLITTISAWVTVIGGAILGAVATGSLVLPETIVGIITTVVAIGVAVTQYLTGKNANGTNKTEIQVATQTKALKRLNETN